MYCKECERYPKINTTKEAFCSECLEQKIVNDRSTSGICEDCSNKYNLCTRCGESLLSSSELIQINEVSNDENLNTTESNLENLLQAQEEQILKQNTYKNKIKPITPQKAKSSYVTHMSKYVPDEMLEAVNELLIEQFNVQGDGCLISAKDIMQRCGEKMTETGKDFSTYSEKIFSFAPLYAESGWLVTCEKSQDEDITTASFKFCIIPQNEQ